MLSSLTHTEQSSFLLGVSLNHLDALSPPTAISIADAPAIMFCPYSHFSARAPIIFTATIEWIVGWCYTFFINYVTTEVHS
jgi:hypothetical protein